MDVEDVFIGLRDNAATISELRCTEYVPDSIAPPSFFPVDVVIDYIASLEHGMEELMVRCQLLTSRASDRSGQRLLKDFLSKDGPKSLTTALRSDRTLGGACHDLQVIRANGYRTYEHGSGKFYGAGLDVKIIGS